MSATGRRGGFSPLIAGFIAGVVLALVLALLTKINLDLAAPWTHTHTLAARVSDVDGISVSSDVRIAGRIVGQITEVQAKGSYSVVTFHVDDADWPLPADTSASIRLATLLGQKYLQLVPGQSHQAIADDAVIGLQSTKPVVDFDQILNTFDKPTRGALTRLIRTASAGLQGQEGTLQQLIPNLEDLSVHSQVPTQELVTRNSEFNSILINLGITADQLNASRNDLAAVIDNLNSISATLAANQGTALKSFITSTDALNMTTDAVLGRGAAVTLDTGLRQLPSFARYLNALLVTLIPQTYSFTQPAVGAEPSDYVNNNGAIPAKSAIDLIYEIGNATSQGYGSTNYSSTGSPNFQANFFLRQFQVGFDPCIFVPPPNECVWGQHGGPAAQSAAPVTPVTAPSPSPSPSPSTIPSPSINPGGIGSSPSSSPSPGPGPSPSINPGGIGPSSSPSAIPSPSPSATVGPTSASLAASAIQILLWDALFPVWTS